MKRKLRKHWRAGLSDGAIAGKLGCGRSLVRKLRLELALPAVATAQRFDDAQLQSLHAEGRSDADLAHALGVALSTIARRRRALGLAANLTEGSVGRPKGPIAFSEDELRAKHSEGLKDAEIAACLNVSAYTVQRWRLRFGLALNARAEMTLEDGGDDPRTCMLREAARRAFAMTPADPRVLTMLEPFVAEEMRRALA
ncbi:helix-turn-helix domain-containing protein [Salipiger sp. H15]|uniref:Helix-turn-helix domain-containing protein n=1 Tax=Alloyangia sp. H15 TaxID=3029062 RepID=A0AAU8AF68_9RHOB